MEVVTSLINGLYWDTLFFVGMYPTVLFLHVCFTILRRRRTAFALDLVGLFDRFGILLFFFVPLLALVFVLRKKLMGVSTTTTYIVFAITQIVWYIWPALHIAELIGHLLGLCSFGTLLYMWLFLRGDRGDDEGDDDEEPPDSPTVDHVDQWLADRRKARV